MCQYIFQEFSKQKSNIITTNCKQIQRRSQDYERTMDKLSIVEARKCITNDCNFWIKENANGMKIYKLQWKKKRNVF